MLYVFKDSALVKEINTRWDADDLNASTRKAIPIDSYVFDSVHRRWSVKRTHRYLRRVLPEQVPKTFLTMRLLLNP